VREGRFKLDTGEILYREIDAVLEQLPREAVDAPSIPGGVQGQVGWGPGQPGLVLDMEVGVLHPAGWLELEVPSNAGHCRTP